MEAWVLPFLKDSLSKVSRRPPCISACPICRDSVLKHTYTPLWAASVKVASKFFKKGDILFKEGQYINGVFYMKDGVCKVTKRSDNGRDQIVKLIKKGDLIGERSLISEEPSNLKATAVNDVQVCFMPNGSLSIPKANRITPVINKTTAGR